MEPVGCLLKHGGYYIKHRCVSCGFLRLNKTSPADDFDSVAVLPGLTGQR